MTTLTNDQITAGAAVLCDLDLDKIDISAHCGLGASPVETLKLTAIARHATASPQVADIAELPPLPKGEELALGRFRGRGLRFSADQMQQYARDAIAASRRAGGGDGCKFCLGAKGGVPGNANRIGGEVICDYCTSLLLTIRDAERTNPTGSVFATPAPASAGQAAPVLADLPEHRLDYIARQYFADEQYQQYVKHAISDAFQEARLAAQPAEGAGQAGHVARPTAWLATDLDGRGDVAFTKEEAIRRAGEGCTHLFPLVEPIDLIAPTERAAAPAEPGKDEFARGVIAALGVLNAHGYSHGSVYHDEIVQSVGEASLYAAAEEDDYRWAGLDPSKKPRCLATHQPSAQKGGDREAQ